MRKFAVLVIMLAVAASFTEAADGPSRFQRFDFKVRGAITDVITEDLNADGAQELIVIHVDKSSIPPRRYLSIFLQDPKTGFNAGGKVEWFFPREVAAVDVGDVKPDKGRELVFITEKGISYSTVKEGKISSPIMMMAAQSIVAIPYDQDVPYYNFVRDYTGDGKDDILICGFYDTVLARQEANYSFSAFKLNLRPTMEINTFDVSGMMGGEEHPMFRVAYYVPQAYSKDYNADGLTDLVVSFRNEVLIFAQARNGFLPNPVKRYHLQLFKDQSTRRRSPANFVFEDLDKDQRLDVVINQTQGDLANIKSRTVVFFGKSGNLEKGVPDLELKTRYPALGAFIRDVNKDGLLDIIVPTIDFGAWTAGKAIVTGDINVEWAYFIQNANKTFSPAPSRLIVTRLKFNVSKFRLESGIPNIFGDFNADGFPDQALGEDKNLLVITCRDGQGRPLPLVEKISVPVSIFTRTVDLNNDHLSDLVIFYPEDPQHQGNLHVFLNRGPWK